MRILQNKCQLRQVAQFVAQNMFLLITKIIINRKKFIETSFIFEQFQFSLSDIRFLTHGRKIHSDENDEFSGTIVNVFYYAHYYQYYYE